MKQLDKSASVGTAVYKEATGEQFTVNKVYTGSIKLQNKQETVCIPACRWHEYKVLPDTSQGWSLDGPGGDEDPLILLHPGVGTPFGLHTYSTVSKT